MEHEASQEQAVVHFSKSVPLTNSATLTVDLATFADTVFLRIYKTAYSQQYVGFMKGQSVAFPAESVAELSTLLLSVADLAEVREYGSVGKYRIYTSIYEGVMNFQIRKWAETQKYSGPTKVGIVIPIEKFEDFRNAYADVASNLHACLSGELAKPSEPVKALENREDYF